MKRILKIASILTTLIALGYISFSIVHYLQEAERVEQEVLEKLRRDKVKIEAYVFDAMNLAGEFAAGLQTGTIGEGNIDTILMDSMKAHDAFHEMIVCYAPGKYKQEPYKGIGVSRQDSLLKYTMVEFNYTLEQAEQENHWYTLPMQNGAMWMEPYYCPIVKTMLMEFCMPFNLNDGDEEADGVVIVGYSLDWFREYMKSLKFQNTGYAILLSKEGRFLYHPKKDLVTEGGTILELAQKGIDQNKKKLNNIHRNSVLLKHLSEKALAGDSGCYNYTSVVTHEKMKFCFKPVEHTNWSFCSLSLREEFNTYLFKFKHYMINGIILLVLSIILLFTYFYFSHVWKLSFRVFLSFLIATIAIWVINWKFPEQTLKGEVKITNPDALTVFKHSTDSLNNSYVKGDVTYIPTGIFVQSIEFNSANNFNIKGYLWQRYDTVLHKDVSRGFVMPEASASTIKESYRTRSGRHEVVGWNFTASIRERFDYKDYPFDKEKLWLRLWHMDFNKNIVLVPFFESYDYVNPIFKPGLEKDFVLPGWDVLGTFFSYRFNSYNVNFGIEDYVGQKEFPELYFTTDVYRNYLNPFMSHMIPLVVVFLMLFSILQVGRKSDDNGLFGFNTLSTLSACSALFFVIIFDHISLRNSLSVSGLVYFEWFYLIAYMSIMYVSMNAIVIARNVEHKYFNYSDTCMSRTLFGPVITGTIFIITVLYFY